MINIKKNEIRINNIDHITNSYIVYDDSKNAVLIDPGDEANKIIDDIKKNNLNLKYIILTHAHADHIGAVPYIVNEFKCRILVHENDYNMLFDNDKNCSCMLQNMKVDFSSIKEENIIKISDDYNLELGEMQFHIIHTPGHTSGSICIELMDSKILFTGDTIFCNCYGRCDLYSSSIEDMKISLEKIFEAFSNDTIIYPGHNNGSNLKEAKKRIKMLMAFRNV